MIEMAESAESRSAWIRRVQELVRNWQESVTEVVNSNLEPMRPERLCRELTDANLSVRTPELARGMEE